MGKKNENGLAKLFSLGFLLAAIGTWQFLEAAQKTYNANKRLANAARDKCTDINLSEISDSDTIPGDCYSFRTHFQIAENVCSPNTLSESICGQCIDVTQKVQQYQEYEVQVCDKKRMGGSTESRTFDLEEGDLTEEDKKEYEKLKRNQNCRQEKRYGWRSHKSPDMDWNFPSVNDEDHGNRKLSSEQHNLRFADFADNSHSVQFGNFYDDHYDEDKMVLSMATAYLKTGAEDMQVWNKTFYGNSEDLSRDPYQLCLDETAAADFDADGLTDSEFQASANYGNITAYPHCHLENPDMPTGTYKLSAKCNGRQQSDIRIIGTLKKNGTHWNAGPYSDSENYPDIPFGEEADFPVYLWVWATDGSLTTNEAIDGYLDEIAALFTLVKNTCNAIMFLCVIGCLVCGKAGEGKSSSSSSR